MNDALSSGEPIEGAAAYAHSAGVSSMDIANADSAANDVESIDNAVCRTCKPETCAGLRAQLARNHYEREQAQLADATYDPNAPLPEGYRRATEADLVKLGLSDGTGTNFLELSDESDFHAEAFVKTDPYSGAENYVIGFKGTESREDWSNNISQGWNGSSEYYNHAREIGRAVADFGASPVSFVGHSLGGGLAATASGASGLPAQTFNAAGLHENTLAGLPLANSNFIRNTYVSGEILSTTQFNRDFAPDALGISRRLPDQRTWIKHEPGYWNNFDSTTELVSKSPLRRHYMSEVMAALEFEEQRIRFWMERNGCGDH